MIRAELIVIGYWHGEQTSPGWPAPVDFVDTSWDVDERDIVASYLEHGFMVWGCMGFSPCRFCGRDNGNLELSDGTYLWPDGLVHYVADHGVRLPEPFVSHVLSRMGALEAAGRDESWWRGHAGGPNV